MKTPRFEYGCETICNERDIFPVMKILVEDEGMSIRAAAKEVHEDSGGQVTASRARKVYMDRVPGTSVPPYQQPENNDESGKSKESSHGGTRIGAGRPRLSQSKIAIDRSIEPVRTDAPIDPVDSPSYQNLRRLHKKMVEVAEGIQYLMDKAIKPQNEMEHFIHNAILKLLASYVFKAAKLGIDIEHISEVFIKGGGNEKKCIDKAVSVKRG